MKYKKCCQKNDEDKKYESLKVFDDAMDALESKAIMDEELLKLSRYFSDTWNTPSIDMSESIDTSTLNKIHRKYVGRNIFLLLTRNAMNDGVFIKKGSGKEDNIMVIYRNHFQSFSYEKEYDMAMKEIHKWK